MTEPTAPPAVEPQLVEMARMWGSGWKRYVFPGFWLVYLGQTVDGVAKYSHGAGAVAGFVIVAAFAVVYLAALPLGWSGRHRLYWVLYAAALSLTGIELVFAGHDALVCLVYVAVLTVGSRIKHAIAVTVVLALVAALLPLARPSWGGAIDWSTGLSVLLVALAMYGFFRIVQANIALSAARAEVARLAAENERSRIARDLHDLLGHSLTTITVKAGLARRLAEHGEPERAFAEISEVEQLARRTLGDVRAAVSAHREVTLTGELATAREVLRASGVVADLPPSVAETEALLSELFGWIVREGVTNVVRHSRAQRVTVTLGRNWLEIVDDGRGGPCSPGNGLLGLRERVAALGGTLEAGGGSQGFRLRAEVPLPVSGSEASAAVAAP